jgi:deoxyribodipyrimidine photolyase-like uncharacterized protein
MPVILVEAKDLEQWEHGDYKDAVSWLAGEDVLQMASFEARGQVAWERDMRR